MRFGSAFGGAMGRKEEVTPTTLWINFDQQSIKIVKNTMKQIIKKSITQKYEDCCQKDAKMEPQPMPKRIRNHCPNWYRKRSGKL